MATDEERREVAARLRNVEMHAIPDARIADNPMTVEFIAAAVFYDLPYVRGLFNRLADLIEPSASATPTPLRRVTDASATVGVSQRGALLALADEMDRLATELLKTNDLDSNRKCRSLRREHAQDLMVASSRIRETLGVSE